MSDQLKGIWIPRWILELDIKPVEMMLLAEIENLDQDENGCTATNGHFAKRLKCTNQYISALIAGFAAAGYLERKLVFKPGSKEVERRHLHVSPPLTIVNTPINYSEPLLTIVERENKELSKDSSKCAEYSFDDFWNAYGLKRDKTKCAAKFAKLSKKEKAAIERTLPMYVSETTLEDVKGRKFVPRRKNPLTYLNQKTWNDYLERIEEARKDETVLPPEMQEQYNNYLKWVEEKHPDLLSTVRYLSKEQFKIYKTVSKRQGPSTRKWALGKAHRELSDGEASAANVFERYDAILDERLKAQAV